MQSLFHSNWYKKYNDDDDDDVKHNFIAEYVFIIKVFLIQNTFLEAILWKKISLQFLDGAILQLRD